MANYGAFYLRIILLCFSEFSKLSNGGIGFASPFSVTLTYRLSAQFAVCYILWISEKVE